MTAPKGFAETAGDTLVARGPCGQSAGTACNTGATYAGGNPQFTMGVRNSRFGYRIAAPEVANIRTSGLL